MRDPQALIVERVIDTFALLFALIWIWAHDLGGEAVVESGPLRLLAILAAAWLLAKFLYSKRIIPVTPPG